MHDICQLEQLYHTLLLHYTVDINGKIFVDYFNHRYFKFQFLKARYPQYGSEGFIIEGMEVVEFERHIACEKRCRVQVIIITKTFITLIFVLLLTV